MPRVVIQTDDGEVVGEVPVHEVTPRAAVYAHGWDGIEFERLWAEARAREERMAQAAESEEGG